MAAGHKMRARAQAACPDLRPAWAVLPLAGAILLALMALAAAQDNPPAPPGTIAPPGSQAANPKSPGVATPDSPGTGLQSSSGVIKPPSGVDPGIHTEPPVPAGALPTPVIPPPGTSGGDPTVQPK